MMPSTEPGEQQRFGVTHTTDGGTSFTQTLIDERIFDLAFDGDRVYAAGDNGLFVSDDDGTTWTAIRRFALPENTYHRPDAGVRAVATTRNAVWVGTTDGLLRSTDNGTTWTLFRAAEPLDSDTPGGRSVETYAYPNPFTPSSDQVVRIRYERDEPGTTRVRILDFEMRSVRTLRAEGDAPGEQELVWDGTDESGLRLPNGTYFYEVETDQGSARGKILLID
ncbi:MAG: FlgD immunoglobulin-like domain containing protein [Longimonas sp.]|uniref:WD40/YVTN/BNR-like repeat-containing protein n=1 Tax=Longimonas sp. TaxID=2039626 RepID=UPI003974F86F